MTLFNNYAEKISLIITIVSNVITLLCQLYHMKHFFRHRTKHEKDNHAVQRYVQHIMELQRIHTDDLKSIRQQQRTERMKD